MRPGPKVGPVAFRPVAVFGQKCPYHVHKGLHGFAPFHAVGNVAEGLTTVCHGPQDQERISGTINGR